MAGHIVTRYLQSLNKYEITNASLEKLEDDTIVVNVEDKDLVKKILVENKPDVVINCIGLLIKASADHPDMAIYLNSYFPHYLAELGKELNFKTIHLSTDCVFSGKKGGYSEDDLKDGKDIYAQSKALGEIINDKDLTFRTSIIGPEIIKNGSGLFHWVIQQSGDLSGYGEVYWTGLTTLELAKAINAAIEQDLTSLYHLVPNEKISKFDLLQLIKEVWDRPVEISKSNTPKNDKSLINNRKDFNYKVPNYRQMLIELYEWMKEWEYKNYNL